MNRAGQFWCWFFGHAWQSTSPKGDTGVERCIHCGKVREIK